jgi:hypothetical protein
VSADPRVGPRPSDVGPDHRPYASKSGLALGGEVLVRSTDAPPAVHTMRRVRLPGRSGRTSSRTRSRRDGHRRSVSGRAADCSGHGRQHQPEAGRRGGFAAFLLPSRATVCPCLPPAGAPGAEREAQSRLLGGAASPSGLTSPCPPDPGASRCRLVSRASAAGWSVSDAKSEGRRFDPAPGHLCDQRYRRSAPMVHHGLALAPLTIC